MSAKTRTGRKACKTGPVPGGCLVLGFHVPVRRTSDAAAASSPAFAPNAFIRIGGDETVTLAVNKSEMGQGVFTALPMLICEELEADWSKVRVASASVAKEYRHTIWRAQGTGGSTSVVSEWDRLRRAGAAAREMLISAAAATFPADRSQCRAENGAVIPAWRGTKGHPTLFPRPVLEDLGTLATLRDVIGRHSAKIALFDVDDEGVVLDMDTPGDYRRILDRQGP
jgi:CO/xanthine dehydrogenase Mo-binding subunit